MIIKILSEDIDRDDNSRFVSIIISDGSFPDATHYKLGRGGLPLVGDLQPILESEEDQLWQVAQAKDNSLTTRQVRRLVYNSQSAGGWSKNESEEALLEHLKGGDSTKLDIVWARRAAIRADWPLA